MKKIFFSLLAVAAIASCAKTEPVYVEDNSEIKLAPVTSMLTKAQVNQAIDGTEYPAAERFTVVGYWANEPAGSNFTTPGTDTPYLDNVEFAKNGEFWAGFDGTSHFPYYWPKNGSLRFAAYSPSVVDGGKFAHDLATDTWTVTGYVQSNDTKKTIDFMVAKTPLSYTAQTAAENVSVVFEHALSWIEFKVKAQDEVAAAAYTVKSVTVNNVNTVGNMEAKYPAKVWDVESLAQPKPYAVFSGSQSISIQAADIVNTGVVVIPQPTTTVTVEFEQNTLPGVTQKADMTLTLDAEGTPWEPGKHYIYTLVFTIDEILINPSVTDWEDVNVGEIEVGTTRVFTAEQLAAAFAKGGKIVLEDDIETTTSFKASKEAVLDLNGHTIAGTDNLTTSYALIEVQPDVTFTVEGPGTLTAIATNNRGWNAFSSVLSNQRGTLVVNEGVVIEHFGKTDMAYGIDNLTNTGAQPAVTYVNGATVKSPYRAIRQFLNSTKANNELQVKAGSVIEGTNKSIWSQNANANANPGKTVVEAGAVLKGDVMLSASNATVWPVEVSIAASALVDPSTVVPSNVPATYTVQVVDGNYVVAVAAPAAVAAGETYTLTSDVVAPATVAVAGTFDGNNNTIAAASDPVFVSGGMYQFVNLNGGNATVQNVTIDGNNASATVGEKTYGVRNIVVTAAGTYTIDNVKSINATYPLHVSTTAEVVLNVTNSTLEGWTSYNPGTTGNFKSVAFTAGNYARFRPYGNAVLTNCAFDKDFVIDLAYLAAGKTVTFVNCTYDGAPLTAEKVATVDGAKTMAGTFEIK